MNDSTNIGLIRELSLSEVGLVSGGDVDLIRDAWELGQAIGTSVYNQLDNHTKDVLGGTIYEMVHMDWDTFYDYWFS